MVKSQMAALSPASNPSPKDIFLVVKSYFDGSQTDRISMTLAAIAGRDSAWAGVEGLWEDMLRERGGAPYPHMKEAMKLEGAFRGWKPVLRNSLIKGLRDGLVFYASRREINVFTCTIDIGAHSYWKRKKRLSSPEELCFNQVFQGIVEWYRDLDELILPKVELIFDRNEGFKSYADKKFNNSAERKKDPFWDLVHSISEMDMRQEAGLQCADMLAWSWNRLESKPRSGDLALKSDFVVDDSFSTIARQIVGGFRDGRNVRITEFDLATKTLWLG
ncbi:MAG: hypothetical protein ACKV2U_23740 [Bryobacteraceae bacterium]